MHVTAEWVFWGAAAVILYVYVGYPLLLAGWTAVASRPVRKAPSDAALPPVSIVIAARNEGQRLADRLNNLLALEYPAERQVIVVSDGSTDDTAAVVRRFAPAVELLLEPPRGKAAALNAGVARARHEIVVFADARQSFAPDALRHLARNFADPSVGAVSGELVLDAETTANSGASSVGEGVGLYWRYEKWLRRHESRVGSTLGTTGAIYAMRRECWRPLPVNTLLDDVLAPMRIVLAGRRVVFDEDARAFDRAAADGAAESRRKVRTLAGNYQLAALEPRVLAPLVNPVWVQFLSHKVGRLVVPYALLACFVANTTLVRDSAFYALAFVAQVLFAVLSLHGAVLDQDARRAAVKPHPRPASFSAQQDTGEKRAVNA
jgi:cellulose synthase/poly-beta-1,6-N-acetylglucosamine synthase-like glycosyltransferase